MKYGDLGHTQVPTPYVRAYVAKNQILISDQTLSYLGTIPTINGPRKLFQSFILSSDDEVWRFGSHRTLYECAYVAKNQILISVQTVTLLSTIQ